MTHLSELIHPKTRRRKISFIDPFFPLYTAAVRSLLCISHIQKVFHRRKTLDFPNTKKNTPAAHDMQGGKWKHSKWTGKNCFFFCLTFAHADCMIRPKTRPDKKFLHTILSSFSDWKHKTATALHFMCNEVILRLQQSVKLRKIYSSSCVLCSVWCGDEINNFFLYFSLPYSNKLLIMLGAKFPFGRRLFMLSRFHFLVFAIALPFIFSFYNAAAAIELIFNISHFLFFYELFFASSLTRFTHFFFFLSFTRHQKLKNWKPLRVDLVVAANKILNI